MNSLEDIIVELESAGLAVTLEALGGVEEVLDSEFHLSSAFGIVTNALSSDWSMIGDHQSVVQRLAEGLERNADRIAVRESVGALQRLPLELYAHLFLRWNGEHAICRNTLYCKQRRPPVFCVSPSLTVNGAQ
ncbi:hypothetical protein [Pseudovibrio denitrificans]|uniref:hypothetical protein n=1 Tax=Pseudovibrio denitrificans TaxID=258256 RepID=UPI000A62D029|nr:hypothetical protein [Pseudovibrio denitrificans]